MVLDTLTSVAILANKEKLMIDHQKRFAAHYAETGNGVEAARRAG